MAAQAVTAHVTPKQLAADRANLRKARAAQAGRPRTAKQRSASRHNLVRARAARSARKHGQKFAAPVTSKKPKAASLESSGSPAGLARLLLPAGLPEAPALDPAGQWRETIHLPGRDSWLHSLPACAAVAVAAALEYQTGIAATADEILILHEKTSGEATFGELLELLSVKGFAGARLISFRPCDPDLAVPGLVYGLAVPAGYHAVLATDAGVLSWGRELSWPGAPQEAWLLDWGPDAD